MAKKLITVLEDDIDGTEAEETVSFHLDEITYEIDLNSGHAEELRNALQPYIDAGRKQRSHTAGKQRPSLRDNGPTNAQVRVWAQEHGINVTPAAV